MDSGLGDRHQQNGVNYTLDLNTGLTQVLSDGTNTYLYGNGRIAQAGSTTEYFLGDALGSMRQLADSTGVVTLTQSYAPYGETISSVGSGYSAYQFTGESRDVNGLTYLRARYYAPQDGRFVSRDTWDGEYNRPLSLNRWGYVEGNPFNKIDPSGHYATSSAGNVAVPVQPSAQAHIYSVVAQTGSQEALNSALGCSELLNQSYMGVIDFAALGEALKSSYVQGWELFETSWSVIKNQNASGYQTAVAVSYLTSWGGAHGLFGLGVGLLICASIGPECVAAVEILLEIGANSIGDGSTSPPRIKYNEGAKRYYDTETGRFIKFDDIPWPDDDGFITRKDGIAPIGKIVDKYGDEKGRFLAPYGTPYETRGIPEGYTEYHVYEVVKEFPWTEGEATGVDEFGSPGGGIQYMLPEGITVEELVGEYLRRIR